jgi:hypothetical protein
VDEPESSERVYVITAEQLRDIELLRRGINPCHVTLPDHGIHGRKHDVGGRRRP